jgi:hypothetical protein
MIQLSSAISMHVLSIDLHGQYLPILFGEIVKINQKNILVIKFQQKL